MAGYLLGIDNGGTITKAAIYDPTGKEVAVASCKTKLLMPKPGFTERDMNELWEANAYVIREVVTGSGIDPKAIKGIGVTGHGNGLYLVDTEGRPVCNGIISTDTRAKDFVINWEKDGTADRIREKTLQAIYAGQPVALLAWLKKNQPEKVSKTKWILMCKDYIRFCLTGEAYAEITDISAANLVNVGLPGYDTELLKEYGLEEIMEKLPPICKSTDISGFITKEAAMRTGLAEGTPVAGGMCDMDACAVATGIMDEDKICVIAGTWSINQYISRKPVITKDLFLSSIYCIEGFWLNIEASATSASNLEWFAGQFLVEEKLLAREKGISIYNLCDEMVSDIKPEDSSIVFMPFLFGSNTGQNARACFIGLNGWHTKAHILRAVYEGIVFCHLDHINRLLLQRPRPGSVRISGGAARSMVWVQMFADILELDIEVVKGSELGTSGAAICAGVATGCFGSYEDAISTMVEVSYVIKPLPENKNEYARKFKRYKRTVELMKPIWEEFQDN